MLVFLLSSASSSLPSDFLMEGNYSRVFRSSVPPLFPCSVHPPWSRSRNCPLVAPSFSIGRRRPFPETLTSTSSRGSPNAAHWRLSAQVGTVVSLWNHQLSPPASLIPCESFSKVSSHFPLNMPLFPGCLASHRGADSHINASGNQEGIIGSPSGKGWAVGPQEGGPIGSL